jgi:hypothetical protein
MLVVNKYAVNVWIWLFKEEAAIGKKSKPPSSIAAIKMIIERAIKPLSALNVTGLSFLPQLSWTQTTY